MSTVAAIASALDADLILDLRYGAGRIDRLIDRAHAALVEYVLRHLRSAGWEVVVEFSFNVFGERGSVDVLAWHAATRTLLIVEVKSRMTDLQDMLLSLGRKLRLVPDEVRRQIGWHPVAVGRIVVAPGTTEGRAVLERHRSMFEVSLPARAMEIRRWVRSPHGPISGVCRVVGRAARDPRLSVARWPPPSASSRLFAVRMRTCATNPFWPRALSSSPGRDDRQAIRR